MSSKPKSLIICVHSHQPTGNFDNVIEEAFEKSYRPFFEVVDRHPSIPICCHFSGCLIDWLEVKKPEFIKLLQKMSDRGQLEFVGGGYYEPIYGLIPENDLLGQLEMMSRKLESLFGARPQGVWLTERVWDPELVSRLKKAGVGYTILDDLHFEKAGLKEPVTGYYQAKQGKDSVDLFASMKQLRYTMPFRKAEETIEFLHSTEASPEDVFVFGDDCEKFGMWPGTYDWVYKDGWLDQFFTLLEKDEKIKVYHFKDFRAKFSPKRVVKIPHASYAEMMEWSGGRFYNFFEKYPESGYMRDRMLEVSRALSKAALNNGAGKKMEEARKCLYRAQCNCSYWHGVFGGLYLHHLRSAVFENLIQSDALIRQARKENVSGAAAQIVPVKLNSGMRIKIVQESLVSFFNPAYGGALEELDSVSKPINLMCNLQRREESYHSVALKKKGQGQDSDAVLSIHDILGSKEEDIQKYLHYDLHRRLSFMDHFFDQPISQLEFSNSSYRDIGGFADKPYKVLNAKKTAKEILMERKGIISAASHKAHIRLKKIISPKAGNSLEVCYEIINEGNKPALFTFGVEFNFSIGETYAIKGLNEPNVKEWVFNDSWRGVSLALKINRAMNLLTAPVETVSESESGLERTYQELGALFQAPIELKPKESKKIEFKLSVKA